MLVITRRPGEAIIIGSDVAVIVTGIKGNQVRLSVNAPKSVRVDREENRLKMIADGDPALADVKPLAQPVESLRRPETTR